MVLDILKEYIPEEVFNQPKRGFSISLGNWINYELKDDIVKELNDEFLKSVPNLNVEKFKKQLNLHLTNKYDYSFNIWKIYLLAKWYKEFDRYNV